MLLQIAQTKYHHQVPLHYTEIIIPARDTVLNLHLTIATGTDIGSHSQNHRYRSHSQSNSQRSHSRSYHRCSDRSTSGHRHSNTYCHQWDTPHRRSSLHRSSSTHSRDHSRSRPYNLHRTTHTAPSKPTYSSSRSAWTNKDKKYKQVTIDDPPSNYYSSDEPSSESDEDLN